MKRVMLLSLALACVFAILFAQPVAAAQQGADRVEFGGGDIVVALDEVVTGNVAAFGGNITIDGKVEGDVTAMGGHVVVNGEVGGSVSAVGGNVTLESTAVVNGGASSVGGQVHRAAGAQVRGTTSETRPFGRGPFFPFSDSPFGGAQVFFGILQGLTFGVLLLLGTALSVAIFPVQIRVVEHTITQAVWPSVGVGLLTLVVLAALSLPLACTCIGLPLAWLAYFVATLFGLAALGAIIGQRLLVAAGNRTATYLVTALVGIAVIWVVSIIPFLGGLVLFVASLFAIGAVVLSRFGTISPPFSWQGPRPTPPPAQ